MNRKFGLAKQSLNYKGGGGFFSNFFVSLSLTFECEKNNLTPYVVLDETPFTKYSDYNEEKNSWNWWFYQRAPGDWVKLDNLRK